MAIDFALELDNIRLIPTPTNPGNTGKTNFLISDPGNQTLVGNESLPIFTSPMPAIVDEENWQVWAKEKINPIIPRTAPIEVRTQSVGDVWTAFSVSEVYDLWLKTDQRGTGKQFHICIDCGNGGDMKMLEMCAKLKSLYKNQVIIMAGNIGNPNTIDSYCRAGIDYARVGIASGSLVDKDYFSHHYPMASLLQEIEKKRKLLEAKNLPVTKVIADGGIKTPADVLKAISLGADYVMIGRQFAELTEAAGTVYKKMKDPSQPMKEWFEEVRESDYMAIESGKIASRKFYRAYHGNTSPEVQALRAGFSDVNKWKAAKGNKTKMADASFEWIRITGTLDEWIKDLKEVAGYGFLMCGAEDWRTFKINSKYIPVL